MTFINTSVSSSMTALRLLSGSGIAPVSTNVATPEVGRKSLAAPASGDVQTLLDYAAAAKLTGEGSELAKIMRSTGATTAALETRAELGDDDFRALVMENLMANHGDDPSFQAALRDGTLSIQRPEEAAELRIPRSIEYDLYDKAGNMIGGGGSSVGTDDFNQALYDERARAGLSQSIGSQMGYDFYASWPTRP